MKRLPKIDWVYWVMIISANTVGEAGGDLISQTLALGYGASTAVLIGCSSLQWSQRFASRFNIRLSIGLSSSSGTAAQPCRTTSRERSDSVYGYGTLSVLVTLAVIFRDLARRFPSRPTIGAPLNPLTETLYWAAILASSTLVPRLATICPTARRWALAAGTLVLAGALAIVVVVAAFTRVSRDVCYWIAIIVTQTRWAQRWATT